MHLHAVDALQHDPPVGRQFHVKAAVGPAHAAHQHVLERLRALLGAVAAVDHGTVDGGAQLAHRVGQLHLRHPRHEDDVLAVVLFRAGDYSDVLLGEVEDRRGTVFLVEAGFIRRMPLAAGKKTIGLARLPPPSHHRGRCDTEIACDLLGKLAADRQPHLPAPLTRLHADSLGCGGRTPRPSIAGAVARPAPPIALVK
jgi:hypothetical protein